MNNNFKLDLYPHNLESYEKIKKGFLEKQIVSIVHATGTGKSYNALQLALDNKDKKITYLVPSIGIVEHLKEILENNDLKLQRDLPNLEFRTYQSLINLSRQELKELDIDLLIVDEFHHIGAPVWGERVNTIVETHKDMKIFGMTAYTVRDRNTIYERDMVNSNGKELFSNSVVSRYDLCDALIDGVLPKPIYKSGYVYLEKTAEALEERIKKLNPNSKDYKDLAPILKDMKKRLNNAASTKDIFKKYIKPDGKYIYFCPVNSEEKVNDIDTIIEEIESWIKEMGLTNDDYVIYKSTSKMQDSGKSARKAFYDDKDLSGMKAADKLRIMVAINQYNEGIHTPGLDGVIMARQTQSDIVFFEQLGRGLAVRGRTKEEYDKLEKKTLEELRQLCKEKEIKIKDTTSKEEIIEKLLAPVIIDLANNIGFIKELENNIKDRVKEIKASKHQGKKRKNHLGDTKFDIEMINEDLYEILRYMNDRLTMTWMDKYNLAKKYYEHYGNLDILQRFKTINGADYDENGIALGMWIKHQKQAYNGKEKRKITKEQIRLLEEIGMDFNIKDNKQAWINNYNLAKKYYEHYGNLKMPQRFKTINGVDYDEDGIALRSWLDTQKQSYNGKGKYKITKEQIRLLKEIGMDFNIRDNKQTWINNYNLAKKYYEYYGNLKIPQRFRTINGVDYDEDGIALGSWLDTQKKSYNGKGNYKKVKERIRLLEEIGMNFNVKYNEESWKNKYNLAKKYYEYYGNLKMPQKFKTINGIDYDEDGIALGMWIAIQKQAYNGKGNNKITDEQIRLLEEIGVNFNIKYNEESWKNKYNLAKKYYEHYGNLKMPQRFKTINGIDYNEDGIALGMWLTLQKQAYTGKGSCKITKEQIRLLEEIGMHFNVKYNEEAWMDKYDLAKKYYEHYGNLKIPQKFKTINGVDYDENGIALGSWLQNQKQAYNGKYICKITEEQIRLLEEINFNIKYNEESWKNKYNLAKKYYEYYGNLKIPQRFKTINGIDYDEDGIALGMWIAIQKQAYNGKGKFKITKEQIRLLEEIGIVWVTSKTDEKLQKEEFNSNNIKRKEKEITNRVYSYLGKIDNNDTLTKEKINEGFIDELNKNFKR